MNAAEGAAFVGEIVLIVARAANGVIGREGKLPWHLPADLKRFKQLTMGAPMIMGRRTYESLPGPLPGRRHIVLTRDRHWAGPGAEVARSAEEALALADAPRLFVIGGAEIFRLLEDRAAAVELTEVHDSPEGETFLPPFDRQAWREVSREDHVAADGRPAFSFVRLERAAR